MTALLFAGRYTFRPRARSAAWYAMHAKMRAQINAERAARAVTPKIERHRAKSEQFRATGE